MDYSNSDHAGNCSCSEHKSSNSSVVQTLDELDFERGIWNAAIQNEIERVKNFVARGETNKRDNSGYTALHYAARNGNEEICKILLENSADVNAKTNGGVTPLHRAAMMGHFSIVRLLVTFGAQMDIQDDDGQTPLHRAAAKGHYLVSKYLLEKCNYLRDIKDKRGRMAFELIPNTTNGQFEKLKQLF